HSSGSANSAGGDGTLTLAPPSSRERADYYAYDPRSPVPTAGGAMMGPRAGIARQNAVEARQDVLVYTTPPLQKDTEATGPVRLVLHVSTTALNTDFTAKLVDVHPDGAAYNVTDGILRRSYHGARQPTAIQIELWPTSMLFFKGHRIRLEISSSNYPRFDRNPNTGRPIATEMGSMRADQTVHHQTETPSHLVLPIVATDSGGEELGCRGAPSARKTGVPLRSPPPERRDRRRYHYLPLSTSTPATAWCT